jgi:hypothetical protein
VCEKTYVLTENKASELNLDTTVIKMNANSIINEGTTITIAIDGWINPKGFEDS